MPALRKSLEAHSLNGTKPRYVEEGVTFAPARPKYPSGISGEAKAAFKRLTRLLEERRSITSADVEILRLYAHLYDRHKRALEKLAEEGEIKIYYRLDKFGEQVPSERPNLWLKVAETCEAKMLAQLIAMGLTPQSRGKVLPTSLPKTPEQLPEHFPSREEACAPTPDEIDLSTIHEEELLQ
jgi:P27 family predicted phage terminase small subunit